MIVKVLIALALNIMDIVVGFTSAIMKKQVSSKKMRDGIFKKFSFIFLYTLSILIDVYGKEIGFDLPFSLLSAVVIYVSGMEIISILENIITINPDIDKSKIASFFEKGGKTDDKK